MAAHCFAHSMFGQSGNEVSVDGPVVFPSADFVSRSEGGAATTASSAASSSDAPVFAEPRAIAS